MKKISASTKKKSSGKKTTTKKRPPKSRGNPPVKLKQEKIDLARQTIISVLWSNDEFLSEEIMHAVQKEIGQSFSGDFNAHFEKALQQLEKHKLVEDVPNKKPKSIRLAQRIEV